MIHPHWLFVGVAGLLVMGASALAQSTQPSAMWTYVSAKDGVHLLKLDLDSGALTPVSIASTAGTSFLTVASSGQFLYGVGNETVDGKRREQIVAWAIDAKTGHLTELNRQTVPGQGVCFVTLDREMHNALVASYTSGTVSVFPIDSDGKLKPASSTVQQTGSSVDPRRQQHALAHSIQLDPAGRFAIAADLGADKLFVYRFDPAEGKLTPNDPPSVSAPPGRGPRHFAFDPTGKRLYLVTEMGGTVLAYDYDATHGSLTQFQEISTLPADFKGQNTSAEIQFAPNGKFLYASNRGDTNFISIFSVDSSSGKLTAIDRQPTLGSTPRNFRIDPTGRFLIAENQGSDSLVVFRIDAETGKLTAVGTPIAAPGPQCVKFIAIGEK